MSEDRIKKILNESFFAYFCTTDGQKQPYIAPMFFIFDEESYKLYFVTRPKTRKVENIKSNPFASVTVDLRDPANPRNNEGVMVQGKINFFFPQDRWGGEGEKVKEIHGLYHKKYPTTVLEGIDVIASPEIIIELIPAQIIHWKGSKFTKKEF
ncbi:hypothetical protein AKJ62_02715 [candidate division MSBL1 archaeon SCGC-AAA259D14]|uniref:Pyridoxamine 5'-phosphate oxidase N-terminal domain-containing protein n=1 Tax=candidate division MSBL1 archaeon SCGC-AAA259D14 TaxID=1698261 RepID=A0A133U628_9EURY|nr:hypothetical protein AKJ62_02715 [candidate division MSBL1 archaeon SCGC-AAA259D14]